MPVSLYAACGALGRIPGRISRHPGRPGIQARLLRGDTSGLVISPQRPAAQRPISRAAWPRFGGEQGKLRRRPIEGWAGAFRAYRAVPDQAQMGLEWPRFQLDTQAQKRQAQGLDQLQQLRRWLAWRQVEQAATKAREAVQVQREGAAGQGRGQGQQLFGVGRGLLAEKGQGQVQVGCGYCVARQLQLRAPGADGRRQVRRAWQGEKQAQAGVGHRRLGAGRSY